MRVRSAEASKRPSCKDTAASSGQLMRARPSIPPLFWFLPLPVHQWATNDDWQVSDEVGIATRLLKDTLAHYNIDRNRVYTTGQSMGGMISFYLNVTEPHLFAASMFVGSQWDTKVLSPLAHDRFLYVVSAGDPKASVGMRDLGGLLTSLSTKYAQTEFSAALPQSEQNALTQKLLNKGLPINFIQFTPKTVAPPAYQGNGQMFEHMYSFDHAYLLEPAPGLAVPTISSEIRVWGGSTLQALIHPKS